MPTNSKEWKALNALQLEVGGVFRSFEHEIREVIGHTNYSIIMDRLKWAEHVINNPREDKHVHH